MSRSGPCGRSGGEAAPGIVVSGERSGTRSYSAFAAENCSRTGPPGPIGSPAVTAEPGRRKDDEVRPELAELRERKALLEDEARSEAVAKRHASGRRTARENLADLVDPGSFVEYGGLAIAAQRARREVRELIERTPADGLIGGTARINGDEFGDARPARSSPTTTWSSPGPRASSATARRTACSS